MKPSFALNLSPDGISLLRRVTGGWRRVDDVALDDPELSDKLKIMRRTAASLENGRMATKLVVPNSQILYTTIEAPGPSDEQRFEQIRAALDGLTPYSVDELVFDWSAKGTKCAVAAVASETLREAEAFADEHKFNPVSLVAIPADSDFVGEPFFGLAAGAARVLDGADTVERDSAAIVIVREGNDVVAAPVAPKVVSEDDTTPEPEMAEATVDDTAATAPKLEAPAKTPAFGAAFQSRRAPEDTGGARREPLVSATPSRISFVPVETPPERPAPVTAPLPPLPKRRAAAPAVPPVAPATGEDTPSVTRAPAPAITADTALASEEEAEALTIFGARKAAGERGKPRYLGLILTVLLLIFLAAIALWSSYFLEGGIAGLFKDKEDAVETTQVATLSPEVAEAVEDEENFVTASLTPEEGSPILRVPTDVTPTLVEPETSALPPVEEAPVPRLPDLQSARNFYAATGIWQLPPEDFANPQVEEVLDDLYIASIDPTSLTHDAVALPAIDPVEDFAYASLPPPAAFGTEFTLNQEGLVVPTPEGALSPEGVLIFAGRPVVTPPVKPAPPASALPEEVNVAQAAITSRPKSRPSNLLELNERGRLGGLSLAELARKRPKTRPESPQTAATVDETPTKFAVASSKSPRLRPPNIAKIVQEARARRAEREAQVQTASVAPQSVTPKIPTRASVARRATVPNAINLRRVNLIGVYGTPSARRALVRLPSGRYVKVSVGDRVDGGKVSAIGKSDLRYVKKGKNITLKMPSS